jgi:UTP:GlnB (protein PII) uridylyltransferase
MITPEQWQRHIKDSKDIFFRGPADVFRAFEFSQGYSVFYNALISSKYAEASREVFETGSAPGVAIFSFGAPARGEMFGGSDADVAVYRSGNSDPELLLRENLVDKLGEFGFTKVDTPIWGTLGEARRYMKTSVTEANQVIEAQFICGDPELREKVERMRVSVYDKEKVARNLIFQFFYFDQYYGKKASAEHLNLKYCNGGTRDFLFPMWYSHLKKGIPRELKTTAMERGLVTLQEDGLLSPSMVKETLKYASAIAFVRDEVISLSSNDMDGKLTFVKASELYSRRRQLFDSPQQVMDLVRTAGQSVKAAKKMVWQGLSQYFVDTRSEEWNINFRRSLAQQPVDLPLELRGDEIINTVRIWNIDDKNAQNSQDYMRDISSSDSWIVLASLLSNPHVSGGVIDSVIKRRGLTPGHEYFLEIAARNPNLKPETLEFILADTSTESRFKKPALQLARSLGWQK